MNWSREIAQQLRHEWVGVGDFARGGVEEENTVMRRFQKAGGSGFPKRALYPLPV